MAKELMFSVTAKDCDWSYTRGTGAGGQKKNKTSSAVHVCHRASKARGYAEESRSQHENRITAFRKMRETKEFLAWMNLEIARQNGSLLRAEENTEREMKNIRVEIKEDGKWVEVDKDSSLPNE